MDLRDAALALQPQESFPQRRKVPAGVEAAVGGLFRKRFELRVGAVRQ
ncbi:hypothetical protein [Corallococcus sp. EGB]|nr:hypothetical protein [Corallococcus sp. EGB]